MTTSPNLCSVAAKISRFRMAGLLIPIMHVSLLVAVAALLSLFVSEARADPVTISGPCGILASPSSPATMAGCVLANGTVIGPQGGDATVTSTSFLTHISPVYMNTNGNDTNTWITNSNGAPTTFATSYIELDGFINLFTAASKVNLTLTGVAGGVTLITTENFTTAGYSINGGPLIPVSNCTSTPCGETVFANMTGGGGVAGPITETLTVAITGGGRYTVNGSNEFAGTPEPSSLYLFGSGLLGLAGIVRRKLRRS